MYYYWVKNQKTKYFKKPYIMLYKSALLFLILSTPLVFVDKTLFGIPFWAVVSLVSTLCFALMTILAIEKEWSNLKDTEA